MIAEGSGEVVGKVAFASMVKSISPLFPYGEGEEEGKRRAISLRIAVDLMGSEASPEALWEGVSSALPFLPSGVSLDLIGTPDTLGVIPWERASLSRPIGVHASPSFIPMGATVRQALRLSESSLVVGLSGLARGTFRALISCCNTGALTVAACRYLSSHSSTSRVKRGRPALAVWLPTVRGRSLLLDAGAVLRADAVRLLECANMGSCWWKTLYRGGDKPTLALLNVGKESYKGLDEQKRAHALLASGEGYRFVGNIEASALFFSDVDIVVSDGFSGNILLKSVEGVGALLMEELKNRLQGALPEASWDLLSSSLRSIFDYTEHSGALLLGLKRLVMKCHGSGRPAMIHQTLLAASELLTNCSVEKFFHEYSPLEVVRNEP